MPTFRLPLSVVSLPSGDYFDSGARIDQRPTGPGRGEGRRVRPQLRPAVSLG